MPFRADGTIQLAFDRLLLPLTINRQSVGLREANGDNVTSPVMTYDPVTRVLTLEKPVDGTWLAPGQAYKIVLGVPSGDEDSGGLRAIDRATFDPSLPASTRVIGFVTCPASGCVADGGAPRLASRVRFCNDVFPIFTEHCSAGICHGAPEQGNAPAAGLLLSTSLGVAKTAIGRVAQGANTGAASGRAESPGHLFGVDMPIIAPGSPANSWLMYKMLLSVPRADDAGLPAVRKRCFPNRDKPNPPSDPFGGNPPSSAPFLRLDDAERARLSDLVLGNAMPYPSPDNTISFAELERVRVWIEQGAEVDDCGACEP